MAGAGSTACTRIAGVVSTTAFGASVGPFFRFGAAVLALGLETALATFLAALAGAVPFFLAVAVAFWRFTGAVTGFVFLALACCCAFSAFQRFL